MSEDRADTSGIDRRRVLRNGAVGAVGLTGLVGTSAAEFLDAGTDGGGTGSKKKACYWEYKCEDGIRYARECCPDSIDPTEEHCDEWESFGGHCSSL